MEATHQNVSIRLISDLHLEFYPKLKKAEAILDRIGPPTSNREILIIAGDFAMPVNNQGKPNKNVEKLLSILTNTWGSENVILISGNHEYYKTDACRTGLCQEDHDVHERIDQMLKDMADKTGVIFLQKASVCLDQRSPSSDGHGQVTIVGCTLWSDITKRAFECLNDRFCAYPRSGKELYLAHHADHRQYLENFLEHYEKVCPDDRLVVVTHHLPSEAMIHARFKYSDINSGFTTDMDDLIKKYSHKIDLWCCGHTHENVSARVHGVRIVASPIGYPEEFRDTEPLHEGLLIKI